ncbi:MAG: hypothetical protein Q4B69_00060 [Slackia sp.]|nr:hypothetical protein [Slackia sp.]
MSTLRIDILEMLLADFRAHADAAHESVLCRYFLHEHAAAFRIKARTLWEAGNDAETLRFVADALLHEGRFQKLLVDSAIEPVIATGRALLGDAGAKGAGCPMGASDAAERRRAGIAARLALDAVTKASDDDLRGMVEPERLKCCMNAMLAVSPGGHACVALMEYRLDARLGDNALGSPAEREKTKTIAWEKAGDAAADPDGASYRTTVNRLLADEARAWLVNAGCSLREGRCDGVARIKDIPVDLVELCLQHTNAGALAKSRTAQNAHAADAFALYRALNATRGARRYCIVPIELDPASGAGLYILGTSLFDDDFIAWLFPDIDRKRARIARAYGKATAQAPSRKTAMEAKRLELDERRRAMIRSNNCIIATITHAQAADALEKSHVFDDGLFGAGGASSSQRHLIQGLFKDELDIWPAPIANAEAMERVIDRFRRMVRIESAGSSAFEAYRVMNEEAPAGCPARFLPYFAPEDF